MSAADQDLSSGSIFDEPQPSIPHETAEDWLLRLARPLDGPAKLETCAERTQSDPAGRCSTEMAAVARWRAKKSTVSADARGAHDDRGETSKPAPAFSVGRKKIANLAVSVRQYLSSYLSRRRNSQRVSVHEDYQAYGRWLRSDLGVPYDDMGWPDLR